MFYFHHNQLLKRNVDHKFTKAIIQMYTTMGFGDIQDKLQKNFDTELLTILAVHYGMAVRNRCKPYKPKKHPDILPAIEFLKMDRSVLWSYKNDLYDKARELGFLSITQAIWALYRQKSSSETAAYFERTRTWVNVILHKFGLPVKSRGGARHRLPDMTGQTFGKIKVIARVDMDKPGVWYTCSCLYCGDIIEMKSNGITRKTGGCRNCRAKRASITQTRTIVGV